MKFLNPKEHVRCIEYTEDNFSEVRDFIEDIIEEYDLDLQLIHHQELPEECFQVATSNRPALLKCDQGNYVVSKRDCILFFPFLETISRVSRSTVEEEYSLAPMVERAVVLTTTGSVSGSKSDLYYYKDSLGETYDILERVRRDNHISYKLSALPEEIRELSMFKRLEFNSTGCLKLASAEYLIENYKDIKMVDAKA